MVAQLVQRAGEEAGQGVLGISGGHSDAAEASNIGGTTG
jgi:hypothetical protein